MATVMRENLGPLHDKIIVKLVKEDYMPSFEKTLKQFAKTANVPGFRKGMVPSGMVRKMHGQSVFNEEIIRVAGKELENYMKGEKLSIFAQPMILPPATDYTLNMNNPSDVDFSFEIGLKPEFDVNPAIQNASLTRYIIVASDKMMDDEMDRITRREGAVDAQTEVSDKENIIYSTYEPCDADGNVAGDAQKIEDTEVLDKMPAKMQEMVMGKKPEDTLIICPADVCTEDELAGFLKDPLKAGPEGATQHYKFTLTKVGHLIPAELGPELFEKVFPGREVPNEAEFRVAVQQELQKEFIRITGERLQNDMFETLVHNTKIELPVNFLKRWMSEGGEKYKPAEEVEKEFPSFDHQLRWQLISDQIMGTNGINVTKEEVMTNIKASVLTYFGLGADDEDEAPWMESYMTKVQQDEKMMDETYRRLLFGKLFSYLETQFKIEQKEIDEDAFFKLGDAHAEHHHNH